MTAPDPTPYAAPTDLVTAADVLAWLVAIPPCPYDEAGAWDETDLANELTLRLDRERRQACRRGALAEWQQYTRCRLWLRRDYDTYDTKGGKARFGSFQQCKREFGLQGSMGQHIRHALAFRAAARAR